MLGNFPNGRCKDIVVPFVKLMDSLNSYALNYQLISLCAKINEFTDTILLNTVFFQESNKLLNKSIVLYLINTIQNFFHGPIFFFRRQGTQLLSHKSAINCCVVFGRTRDDIGNIGRVFLHKLT